MSKVGKRIEEAIASLRDAIAEEAVRGPDDGPSVAFKEALLKELQRTEVVFLHALSADEHLCVGLQPDEMMELDDEEPIRIDLEELLEMSLHPLWSNETELRYMLAGLERMVAAVRKELGDIK